MQQWLLYLPAIASPIAVLVAYFALKASSKRLHSRIAATPPPAFGAPVTGFGDVGLDQGNITVEVRHSERV